MSALCLILFSLLLAPCDVHGCLPRWFGGGGDRVLTRSDCSAFPRGDSGCRRRVFLGRRQTEDMALGMYRAVAEDKHVDQVNFLLVPIELGRSVAALLHAVGNGRDNETSPHHLAKTSSSSSSSEEEEERDPEAEAVEQMRCYIHGTAKQLGKTILAPPEEDPDKEEEVHNEETLANVNITRSPRMLMIHRRLFVDSSLRASLNYSMEAMCWYDMEIQEADLSDEEKGAKTINDWAKKQNELALKVVSNLSESDPARKVRKALAGDPETVRGDRAVMASTIYLRVAFERDLFSTKETKPSEPFFVKLRGDGPHANAETNVKVPMMTARDTFPFLESKTYSAASLPLARGAAMGGGRAALVVVVPKPSANLTSVESEVFGSGTVLHSFLEGVRTARGKRVQVSLPRLTIQITHEWTTPRNKTIGHLSSKDGKEIPDSSVGVYHDAFLELAESTGDTPSGEKAEAEKEDKDEDKEEKDDEEKEMELVADKPFLFVLVLDRDVVAMGRIKDPYWCKFCSNRHGGGNHTAVPEAKRKGEGGKLEREGKGGETGGKESWFQRVRESIFGKKKDKDTKEVE